jgi:hypothetical protein
MLNFYLLLFLALASTVDAGAWSRSKGEGFTMTSIQVTAPSLTKPASYYYSNFSEFGLTESITFGADLGHSVSGESKLIVFLRHPILALKDKHHFAAELGVGEIAGEFILRPGLFYGRGLAHHNSSGWLAIDVLFEHHVRHQKTDFKADFTYGTTFSGGIKTILQMQSGRQAGDPKFFRFAPSLAIPMGSTTHLELGGSLNLIGEPEYGLKIGIWKDF